MCLTDRNGSEADDIDELPWVSQSEKILAVFNVANLSTACRLLAESLHVARLLNATMTEL